MEKLVYEIRIIAETEQANWMPTLRHFLENNGAQDLGGIGRMRQVKSGGQTICFLTMLDLARNDEAIRRFDGLRVDSVRIRCYAEHYAFYSGPKPAQHQQQTRTAQNDTEANGAASSKGPYLCK